MKCSSPGTDAGRVKQAGLSLHVALELPATVLHLLGAGHDTVDEVNQVGVRLVLKRTLLNRQPWQLDANATGIGSQHQDTIGHAHRFINIVRDQQYGLRGHALLAPQSQ
jgi:hypothetical protein